MSRIVRMVVAVMEILGGLIGIGLIAYALFSEPLSQSSVIVHCGFVLVFLYGIAAGVALLRTERLGLVLSILYMVIQIPIVTTSIFSFDLFSGASVNMLLYESGWWFNFLFGSRYYFNLNSYEPWCFGVNILALALFILLIRELWLERAASRDVETEAPVHYEQPEAIEPRPKFAWRQN